MDLSNYGKTKEFREKLIEYSPAMIGTVPMYDAIGYLEKDLLEIKAEDFLEVVRAHAKQGVDFVTMCGKMCAVRTTNMILDGKKVEFK